MIDLSSFKLLTYDSTLRDIFLYGFSGNFKHDNEGVYYYRSLNPRLKDIKGTYIKLIPITFYYKDQHGKKWTVSSVSDGSQIDEQHVIMVRFKIIGIYYSIEKLNSKSKLKGFSRVIDDNNYFSAIPIINELTHWDNGIITSSEHTLTPQYFNGSWDDFKVSSSVLYNGYKHTKMTGGVGHTHL